MLEIFLYEKFELQQSSLSGGRGEHVFPDTSSLTILCYSLPAFSTVSIDLPFKKGQSSGDLER